MILAALCWQSGVTFVQVIGILSLVGPGTCWDVKNPKHPKPQTLSPEVILRCIWPLYISTAVSSMTSVSHNSVGALALRSVLGLRAQGFSSVFWDFSFSVGFLLVGTSSGATCPFSSHPRRIPRRRSQGTNEVQISTNAGKYPVARTPARSSSHFAAACATLSCRCFTSRWAIDGMPLRSLLRSSLSLFAVIIINHHQPLRRCPPPYHQSPLRVPQS